MKDFKWEKQKQLKVLLCEYRLPTNHPGNIYTLKGSSTVQQY